ncbi:MAG: sulfurtransferase TusA family protein [Prevotellaceae bacterium]|jgi:sulfite reductase (ferredoxin)|nr:sulfurtransferase TusA family protein [Prevotellaceae bacterium]
MYKLPETLGNDIATFASLAKDYRDKKVEAVQFKAYRVPMGIYEQRQDEVYMSRVRTTGGVIYPAQLLKLIAIAQKYGSNLLHITTRQEIQVQNLKLDSIEPLLYELKETTGLSTKGGGGNTVRNILVSEDSGLLADEVFDTTPYAMALTTKLIAEADSYFLPRKMKIAFSSDDKQVGYAAVNDVGFVAKIKDGEKGFLVYAGGGAGAKPTVGWKLFDFVPAGELFVVAEALKKFFSEHGNRKDRNKARLRFIFYKLGEAETVRLIKEYYGEAKKRTLPFALSDTENERPPYSYHPPGKPRVDAERYHRWKNRYVTPQKQEGYSSILFPVLLGNISLTDEALVSGLQRLLSFVGRFGSHTLRFTTTQSIRFRNIPDAALPELYAAIRAVNPDADAPVLVNNIVSCTGADTCRLGIGLSKGLATAIRRELLKSSFDLDDLSRARIHISGCPNSCGQQLWADIGFSGKVLRNERTYPGYQVYLAASRDVQPRLGESAGSISARDIPQFTRRLLESYLSVKGKYPSLASYLRHEGRTLAQLLIEEYKNIPLFADDKNYYFDWGAESVFSVVGRGTAECSAGLFDMIELDLGYIKSYRLALATEKDAQKRNELLYGIIYSSSRMLLVTRGAEPKTTADVFNLFIENFIEYGFVEDTYRSLVAAARDDRQRDFSPYEAEINALADRIIELYQNMDDSLQFKGVKPQKKQDEILQEAKSAKLKDLRGVACPMNFVQTKMQLSALRSGEILEIWLDDGEPINNVPGSVRNEGHEVQEQTRVDNYWKILIKKK